MYIEMEIDGQPLMVECDDIDEGMTVTDEHGAEMPLEFVEAHRDAITDELWCQFAAARERQDERDAEQRGRRIAR